MSLIAAIEDACQCFAKPPSNEKNTELRVVYPLLLAMGYKPYEIDGGGRDAIGYFPDYTLMPEQPKSTWYIEVKAWLDALDDKGKYQAIDYANRNGKRWVVLTNGRIWRLYDNYCRGVADEKLVVEVRLDDRKAAFDLLSALNRDSLCTERLEKYATRTRLDYLLRNELSNANSQLVNSTIACLQSDYRLEHIQNSSVAEYFRDVFSSSLTSSNSSKPVKDVPQTTMPDNWKSNVKNSAQPPPRDCSLAYLCRATDETGKSVVTFKEPAQVQWPYSDIWIECGSWADLDEMLVRWLHEQNKLPPLPCQITKSKYYINYTNSHVQAHDKMEDCRKIDIGASFIYVFTHGSASDHVRRLLRICELTHVPADEIMVRLRRK